VQVEKILDNGIKAVTIDEIFGKFLSLLVNKIDKSLLEEFIFILLIFRRYIKPNIGISTPTSQKRQEARTTRGRYLE
jgi:hypothetical protein